MTAPELLDLPLAHHRLTALTWGPSDGPPALLLHGYPDTAWTWRHLGPELAAAGYRVVAPFTRGYAPSDLAPDGQYGIGALVSDVLGVHDALGGDPRTVVVGHDWGALEAYGATALRPEGFAKMVTMAVPSMPGLLSALRSPRLTAKQLVFSRYMGVASIPWFGERRHASTVEQLWARWSPGYDATEDLRRLHESLPDLVRWRAAMGYYRGTLSPLAPLRGAFTTQYKAVWAPPAVPSLFLWGDQDGCMRPAVLEKAAASHPLAEVVPGTGHFLHLEDQDAVTARVLAFLEA